MIINDYVKKLVICWLKKFYIVLLVNILLELIQGNFFYITIILRRLSFINYDERHLAAKRLRADSSRIEELFQGFFSQSEFPVKYI